MSPELYANKPYDFKTDVCMQFSIISKYHRRILSHYLDMGTGMRTVRDVVSETRI